MSRIKDQRDFWSGILFVAFGCAGLWAGRDYPIGTLVRMGPGFFPMMMSVALSAVERTVRYAVGSLWPSREEVRKAWPAVLRGTGLGAVLGILPGGGAVLIVRGLRAGEAHGAGPRALRPGRGGGRRRPGIRQ
jgi:TctA family transporter